MPETEQNETKPTKEETPQHTALEDKLEKLTQSTQSEMSASSQLAKLVSNPQIREILSAQQEGKVLRLVDGTDNSGLVPEVEGTSEPVDLDELSRSELGKYIAKKTIDSLVPLIDKRFKDVDNKIAPLRSSLEASEGVRLKSNIDEVSKKYPDFDKYKPQMVEINKQVNGTLPVEELYFIAKNRDGTLISQTGTQSEKPDAFGVMDTKPATGEYRGQKGFKRLLNEAADEAFSK